MGDGTYGGYLAISIPTIDGPRMAPWQDGDASGKNHGELRRALAFFWIFQVPQITVVGCCRSWIFMDLCGSSSGSPTVVGVAARVHQHEDKYSCNFITDPVSLFPSDHRVLHSSSISAPLDLKNLQSSWYGFYYPVTVWSGFCSPGNHATGVFLHSFPEHETRSGRWTRTEPNPKE